MCRNGGTVCQVAMTEEAAAVRVAVLGAGAFGTALAAIAARNGHSVTLFCRNPEQVRAQREPSAPWPSTPPPPIKKKRCFVRTLPS